MILSRKLQARLLFLLLLLLLLLLVLLSPQVLGYDNKFVTTFVPSLEAGTWGPKRWHRSAWYALKLQIIIPALGLTPATCHTPLSPIASTNAYDAMRDAALP
ncbi:hypothetical protein E4U50_001459 [Claviceps purpurea]|nr:hypothetical protein E4U50_001459 [Claviceps purpurea]